MLDRTDNSYQLTTHLRIEGVPITNNNAELTYNLSLPQIDKRKNKLKKE